MNRDSGDCRLPPNLNRILRKSPRLRSNVPIETARSRDHVHPVSTGCEKTHSGGRPGIHPRYKDNGISGGFSH